MASKESIKLINKFYSGIVRDDRSNIPGALSNAEEVDIFTNRDFIQAEQIMSTYALPSNSRAYAFDAGDDDTMYAYGDRSDTTAGTTRLFSVASGGASNPSTLSTLATSSDTTNLSTPVSDLKFFRTSEAAASLYYIKGASTTWYLMRYLIGTGEQRYTGSAWSASGSPDSSTQLTGLNGSFMRPVMKVIYGELLILHGRYVAKVDKDGVLTLISFTLPQEWEAVDIIPVSDVALILARNKNKLVNKTRAFWWDLSSSNSFDDSFDLPMGGPQWVYNYKETITIFCSLNGIGKFFISQALPGAKPQELPFVKLTNCGTETSTQPVSSSKMVSEKDGILHFGLFKTDKTGIYALGQLDSDKPNALILSKRFHTTDYSLHSPTALKIQGPNFYAAFSDNGTNTAMLCKSLNSPTRSSTAVIETVWIDDDKPFQRKDLTRAYITAYPLAADTSLSLSITSDYGSSYTVVKRADDSVFNTANGLLGLFRPSAFLNKYAYKAKVTFTSATSTSPKLQAIGLRIITKDIE